MVSVKAAPPAVVEVGLRLEIAGGLMATMAAALEEKLPAILTGLRLLAVVTAVRAAGNRPSTSIAEKTTFAETNVFVAIDLPWGGSDPLPHPVKHPARQ